MGAMLNPLFESQRSWVHHNRIQRCLSCELYYYSWKGMKNVVVLSKKGDHEKV